MALALLSLVVSSQTAFALVREINLNGLALQSDAIVVGTVTNANSFWQDGQVYTDVRVLVEQTIKGEPLPAEITVRQPGGQVGDIREWAEDVPSFAIGERAVLFLTRTGEAPFDLAGAFQGKLPVENDNVFVDGGYVPLAGLLDRVSAILDGRAAAPTETEPQPPAAPETACAITSITPASASAGTGSEVDISGTNFDAAGTVTFFRSSGQLPIGASHGPWGPTLIEDVVVPGNWDFGASSGDVTVTPDSAPADKCPKDFYVTFSYNGDKWSGVQPSVKIEINANTPDTTNERAAVLAGAATWNGRARFSFADGGVTGAVGRSQNNHNEIMWVDSAANCDPGAWLAGTLCWVWGSGTITECDVRFNDKCLWYAGGVPPTEDWLDVQSVAVHEFGHFLTLNDLYGTKDTAKIMYGELGPKTIKPTLQPDDDSGIRWIYSSAVGGIAELPDLAQARAAQSASSDPPYAPLAGGLAAGVLAVGAGGWYARRRWLR